jgi:hypothetical protein
LGWWLVEGLSLSLGFSGGVVELSFQGGIDGGVAELSLQGGIDGGVVELSFSGEGLASGLEGLFDALGGGVGGFDAEGVGYVGG